MFTIPVTVRLFKTCGIKNDDSYEDRQLDTHQPCDCWHFLRSSTSKTTTVTRIASWTPTIPVTVDTFEKPGLGVRGPYHGGGGG